MQQAWEFSHPRFVRGKSLEYYSANIRRRTAADFTPSHMELDTYRGEISTLKEQLSRQERALAMKDSELALARRTIEHQALELEKAKAALAAARHGEGAAPAPPAMAGTPSHYRSLPPSSAPAAHLQPQRGYKRQRNEPPSTARGGPSGMPNSSSGFNMPPSSAASWQHAPSPAGASFPPSFAQMGQRGGINPPLPSHDMYSAHRGSVDGPMFRAPSATDSLPDDVSLSGELSGHTPRKFSRGLRSAGVVHHPPGAPAQQQATFHSAGSSTAAAAAVLQAAASDSYLSSPQGKHASGGGGGGSGLYIRANSVTGGNGSVTGVLTPSSALGTGVHDTSLNGTGLHVTMPSDTGGPADALHTLAAAMEGAVGSTVPLRNVRSAASWAASEDDADGVWEALDASLRGGADMGNWDDEGLDRVPGGRARLNSAGSLSHSEIVPPSSLAGSGGSGSALTATNAAADSMRTHALAAEPSPGAVASLLAVLCMAADQKEMDDTAKGMLCMPEGSCTTLAAVKNLHDCVAGMTSTDRANTVFRLVAEAMGSPSSSNSEPPVPGVAAVTAVLKMLTRDPTASKFARLSAAAARARDPKQPANAANGKALEQMQAAFPATLVLACILPVASVHAVLVGCVQSPSA